MNENDTFFTGIGFIAILAITALLIGMALNVGHNPKAITAIASYSPWAAKHIQALSWVAVVIVAGTGLAIPPILMSRPGAGEMEPLARFGLVLVAVIFVPSLGFLARIGWEFAIR